MSLTRLTAVAIASSTAAVVIPSPAFAHDDQRSNYDGPYIAVSAGAAMQNNDRKNVVVFDVNRDGNFADTVTTTTGANAFSPGFCNGAATSNSRASGCRGDKNGREYSVKVGYDAQMGDHFVTGVVLEGAKTDIRDATTAFSTTPASYTFIRKADYSISARGRFGYTPNGSGLFYVTGGPSYAKIKNRFRTTNTANSFTQVNANDGEFGYQMGGGAEFAVTSGVGVGIEYLYNSYKNDDYYVAVGPGTAPATNPFIRQGGGTNFRSSGNQLNYHSVRVNLLYKF
ncbi:outer membrane protein [Novosphingobium tardum]|uniref:Outer membrane protein n=1 Tax=Novosphingobium tardum TaxID=1538021 RepID=A0ABV8RP06_9SPHN